MRAYEVAASVVLALAPPSVERCVVEAGPRVICKGVTVVEIARVFSDLTGWKISTDGGECLEQLLYVIWRPTDLDVLVRALETHGVVVQARDDAARSIALGCGP